MSNRVPRIYLAGPITGLSYGNCTNWREYAREKLAAMHIEGVSPLRAKEYLANETSVGDCYSDKVLSTQKAIVTRDRNDVLVCDGVLANFTGAERVSAGTCIEFGWADAWRKPIVMVLPKGDKLHDHAMLREIAGTAVETLDEGLFVISRWVL